MEQQRLRTNDTFQSALRVAPPDALPPISVRTLMGNDFKDHPDLSLADCNVHIFKIQESHTTTRYMACFDAALAGSSLLALLESIAPTKTIVSKHPAIKVRDVAISAIIDDWRLLYKSSSEPTEKTELRERHARAFGGHWDIFFSTGKPFIEALTSKDFPDGKCIEDAKKLLLESLGIDPIEYMMISQSSFLVRGIYMNTADLKYFFAIPSLSEASQEIKEILRKMHRVRKTENGVAGLLTNLNRKIRAKSLRRAFQQSSTATKRIITVEHGIYESGSPRSEMIDTTPAIQTAEIKIVDKGISIEIKATKEGNNVSLVLDPSSLRRKHFLMPLMHWTTDRLSGTVTWHYDFIQRQDLPPDIITILDKAAISRKDPDKRLSPLAGILVLAYVSPNITEWWLERDTLPDDTKTKQFMRAAQMPIVVQRQEQELMQSAFLEAVERYADGT